MSEQRILHGNIQPTDLARALLGEFNRGSLRAQQIGSGNSIIVQIATEEGASTGGRTGLAVSLRSIADGVSVEVGKQSWLGVAASLGQSAFYALRSPWNLLGRLDDIAQDIENIQLTEEVWRVLDETARSLGAGLELSERLRRTMCDYCLSANPVGEPACIACGAPLGLVQPRTCRNCGFAIRRSETVCPNCTRPLT